MEEELRGEFEGFIGSNLEVEDNGEWMRGNGGGEGHLITNRTEARDLF
jgi:hypothetical protein